MEGYREVKIARRRYTFWSGLFAIILLGNIAVGLWTHFEPRYYFIGAYVGFCFTVLMICNMKHYMKEDQDGN